MLRRMWLKNPNNYVSKPREDSEAQYFIHKKLTFFIGKNNSGKSRFIRALFEGKANSEILETLDIPLLDTLMPQASNLSSANNPYSPLNLSNLVIGEYYQTGFPFFISPNDFSKRKTLSISVIETEIRNLEALRSIQHHIQIGLNKKLSELKNDTVNEVDIYKKSEINKAFYIPILRGMRPVKQEHDSTPYIDRTIKDYFPSQHLKTVINAKNVITGECLYYELMKGLLGEPYERDRIKKYEELLSQYFFDNQKITLIPKYKEDVVYIKIGDDEQHPIHQLGDGLQQAIILTYECFIQNDNIHAFFIEEPELHMHPGMLRQLMNFYLNETDHFYFFTTHSNHLLDMADESDEVIIQKFNKTKKNDSFIFEIKRCDKDRELLSSLGVRPSSVYLANSTIWVEGITDRLYLTKYLQKYLELLKATDQNRYTLYRKFMPNYHYTFVEYQGSNLAHWNFAENYQEQANNRGLNAKVICSDMLLIADGDIKNKRDRVSTLTHELGNQFFLLNCKETENTLPADLILKAARTKFSGMHSDTKFGFDISLLDQLNNQNSFYKTIGIGKILDDQIRMKGQLKSKRAFSETSGTIKDKLAFCRLILSLMDSEQWELTESAKTLCERIFEHVQEKNS